MARSPSNARLRAFLAANVERAENPYRSDLLVIASLVFAGVFFLIVLYWPRGSQHEDWIKFGSLFGVITGLTIFVWRRRSVHYLRATRDERAVHDGLDVTFKQYAIRLARFGLFYLPTMLWAFAAVAATILLTVADILERYHFTFVISPVPFLSMILWPIVVQNLYNRTRHAMTTLKLDSCIWCGYPTADGEHCTECGATLFIPRPRT